MPNENEKFIRENIENYIGIVNNEIKDLPSLKKMIRVMEEIELWPSFISSDMFNQALGKFRLSPDELAQVRRESMEVYGKIVNDEIEGLSSSARVDRVMKGKDIWATSPYMIDQYFRNLQLTSDELAQARSKSMEFYIEIVNNEIKDLPSVEKIARVIPEVELWSSFISSDMFNQALDKLRLTPDERVQVRSESIEVYTETWNKVVEDLLSLEYGDRVMVESEKTNEEFITLQAKNAQNRTEKSESVFKPVIAPKPKDVQNRTEKPVIATNPEDAQNIASKPAWLASKIKDAQNRTEKSKNSSKPIEKHAFFNIVKQAAEQNNGKEKSSFPKTKSFQRN
ncbi:MAG: hypothetical protein IC227_03535 [Enterococcus lacertideformus]|uniref:Uncharacterized protein n=1 Tax=Enterococcus lacertideformus TaxID=2771493 RepID=A0A931FCB2_9ENTE|nr:hypothetical protein [Enterococcus lacertideformus]